ncbi:MAG: putative rRNA methyltransferase [Acidimicrobiales bacterium]|nr:putative rRNA methyltransferase [Acidimicrobiales bacterium]
MTARSGSARAPRRPPEKAVPDARRVAVEALVRIDQDGAYANLLLPKLLARSGLGPRDRAFVTELVYGTTRMQRACDWLVDRFALRELDPPVRAALRLGAYQLAFLGTPPHAAVSATVAVVPRKVRGLVNAVLRRIAEADPAWPSDAVRLSYPDAVVERLTADLGAEAALAALEAMNERAPVTERADGYVQDLASQWVVDLVGARPGDRVLDLCAAPGGKATALAGVGALVVAADLRPSRVNLIASNIERLGIPAGQVGLAVADALRPPFRPAAFDHVLADAPCSGIGSLRRRPDARWRIDAATIDRLALLQRDLLDQAVPLVRPGGTLTYSVCTLTAAETVDVAAHVAAAHPDLEPLPAPGAPWIPAGSGALLLPGAADTDGMAIFRWRRPA